MKNSDNYMLTEHVLKSGLTRNFRTEDTDNWKSKGSKELSDSINYVMFNKIEIYQR